MQPKAHFIIIIIIFACTRVASGQVTAGFTASSTTGCPPLLVTFTNTTTPAAGTTYSWNLGNGSGPDTLTNPGASYSTAGSYTVTLTATHGGLTSTHTEVITVYPPPVVSFTVSDTLVCPGAPDTFTSTSGGGVPGPLVYLWSYGDGYTNTGSSSVHAYTFPGYFNITLQVTNADGCMASLLKPAAVHVRTPANLVFSASNTHLCHAPVAAVFSNSVTGAGPFNFDWAFGDGSVPSTLANPTHVYTATGTYNVGLKVTDAHGCADSTTLAAYISVSNLQASFTGPDSACIHLPVTFNNTSSAYLTDLWLYGDGSTDMSTNGHHPYSAGGKDTVKLAIFDGYCRDTATKTIYMQAPASTFSVTPALPCPAPETSVFSATALPGSVVTWHFGDSASGSGTTINHQYASNNFFTVQLYVTSTAGCRDTVTQLYKVYDLLYGVNAPYPGVATTSGCIPLAVTFFPVHQTSLPGPFPANYPYPVTNYTWNFGDGSAVSSDSVAVHNYAAAGVYTVTSVMVSSNGCRDTATSIVATGTKPDVTFTATPTHECAYNNEINFTVSILSGSPNVYSWYLGDGSSSSVPLDSSTTIAYQYMHAGVFSDTLVAYSNGCADTAIRHHYITIDSPGAVVSNTVLCAPANTVQFTDSSEGENSHVWIFGDGSTSTLFNPLHTYSAPATFNGLFADYNIASGCHDTVLFAVNLTRPAVTIYTADSAICRDEYLVLNSSVISGYVGGYQWIAGGSSAYYLNYNFVDTFHSPGLYTIKLVVKDQNQCADTVTRTNYILVAKPAANFTATPANVCLPYHANYADASVDVPGTFQTSFDWTFGDGESAAVDSPTIAHTYTSTGVYTATEIVTDNIGCRDTVTKTLVNVYHPSTSFTANVTQTCAYAGVVFTSVSTPGVSSYWTFGDGTSSVLANPVHAYTDTGTYSVRLVVTDVHGCTDTFARNNYITVSKPHAAFSVSDSVGFCPPFTVHFTNASSGGVSSKWTFGNGDSSAAANPSVIYASAGYDAVVLVETNSSGCRDTAQGVHVKVYGFPGAFSYTPDSGCSPVQVFFNADLSSVSGLSGIKWDFSDGTIASALSDTITHTYSLAGSYLPKLIISDSGCTDTSIGNVYIRVDVVSPGFTASPNPVCLGDTLRLADTSHSYFSVIDGWSWVYHGTSGTLDSETTVYTLPGTDSISLQVTDGWGCSAHVAETEGIYTLPAIGISPDSVLCAREQAYLTDSAPGGQWSTSNAGIAAIGDTSGVVTGIGSGYAVLTYSLSAGCLVTRAVTVHATPDPGVVKGNPGICTGDSTMLSDSVAGGVWRAANGDAVLAASGYVMGVRAGVDTISYTVANGRCDSTAQKVVLVYALPDAGSISGRSPVCVGAVVALTDPVAGGKWSSGSPGVIAVDSSGNAEVLGTGSAVVTYRVGPDANGCFNQQQFSLVVIAPDFALTGLVTNVSCYRDSNGSITISPDGGQAPFDYRWANNSTASALTGLDTGMYALTVTEEATQCVVVDTFTVGQPDSLQLQAAIQADVCGGRAGSIVTTVSGGTAPYAYLWQDKSTGADLTGLTAGVYELEVADAHGCTGKMSYAVADTCNGIVIHDAVSPNGDGINDTWIVEGLQLYPSNTVQVFDKWGDELFSATNYQNDWAGAGKRGPVPDGTYYYLVKLNTSNAPNGKQSYTGYLLIKR